MVSRARARLAVYATCLSSMTRFFAFVLLPCTTLYEMIASVPANPIHPPHLPYGVGRFLQRPNASPRNPATAPIIGIPMTLIPAVEDRDWKIAQIPVTATVAKNRRLSPRPLRSALINNRISTTR